MAEEEANKRAVLEFYEATLNRKDVEASVQSLGGHYIQHNPNAKDGIEGFRHFIAMLKQQTPLSHSEIKRVLVDGDFVALHVHKVIESGTAGNAIMDIFRLEAGKIVEHWDVTQAVPDKTVSGNPMF